MTVRRMMAAALAATVGITGVMSAPVLAAPAEDGVLRTAILGDITTLDVAQTTDDYMVPMNVYDRLFETRMINGTAAIVNSLCTNFAVSDDGLVYDFTLQDGVVFSNGNTLTSSDVQYSFERLLIAAGDNTDIPLEVVGAEALMNGEADKLEGFEVKDDTHFSITLAAPNAGFLAELSAPAMSILDAESMADVRDFGKDPKDVIGTGPYIITEWVSNDHYTLEYNDKYWGLEPTVKKAVVSVIPDANTQNLMFQNGELDMIDLISIDSAIVASTYKTQYAEKIVSTPKVGLVFLLLNNSAKYLEDVKVRKAIGMAVDVDSIINGIYNGDAHAEYGIIPTGIFAHNDYLEGFTYDPAAAKDL
ncbi:MAG: ABC transporter substrate-binding protein, partial [Lachnospiraceae bacterium]|nr:ABC transporter substrate-binding protein [Lachnospiraceae bacterium]